MKGRIDEGRITGAIDAISLENIDKITKQMKTSICQVNGEQTGTGFFCKIKNEGSDIPLLITNYHIISDDFLQKNKKFKISINNGDKYDTININENSKIYSSIRDKYDIMIIKLKEEKNMYNYLELDEHLFEEDSEDIYKTKSIYILHYPSGNKAHVSFGYGIEENKECEYYINHFCNTEHCSSGSPILNLETNKVIGIHSGFINKESKFNLGILLKYPLNELNMNKTYETKKRKEVKPVRKNEIKKEEKQRMNINKENIKKNELLNQIKTNEIKLEVKINKNDINRDIYFLDNADYNDDKGIRHYHDNLKELNGSNTELYINDQKHEYKKYFNPDKEGIYIIKLKFNINIKDCSYMFCGCSNIINIDLSSFQDTKNINNMKYMFHWCNSLKSLPDISKWDTKNVNGVIH